jgi:hypothetical protein
VCHKTDDSDTVYSGIVPQDSVPIALSTCQIGKYVCVGGGKRMVTQHSDQSQLGLHLQANPSFNKTGFTIYTNFHTIIL